ncbi:hypothetical protein [Photobacterium sp. GB-3]|uniref:hypothetical protein n=1 Tax=Photobacterium sp. GB-3 TaxID=2022110 RepID=UPI000D152C59|nr:hypothetical protein [Photobacterium sp. GB-3]PSV57283.1 hypothetical protein C9J43_08930 [Photobacterium sp. GB-3]
MTDIYKSPESEVEIEVNEEAVVRPKPVFIIGLIFIVLAIIDFAFSAKNGFIHTIIKYDAFGTEIGTGVKVDLLWLFLYGIGSGVMRGGRFARAMAAISGTIALIIPGALIIYYLYFSSSKEYFNSKKCPDCGDTSYTNSGYKFDAIDCKKCTRPIEFKNA